MTAQPTLSLIYLRMVLVALIWGGTFIAGRVVATEMAASTAALWRYVVASGALLILALVRQGGLPRLDRRQWIGVSLLGATGVALYNICFMYGLERIPAARAALIVALNPAAVVLGAAMFLGEPLARDRVVGIIVALLGVSIVLGHGNPANLFTGHLSTGDFALFGCVLGWSAYTLLGESILRGLSPFNATAYAALTGTLILAVVALASGGLALPNASAHGWLSLVFLGVLGTAVAFVWFYDGVRAIGPARTSVFINLVPVAAAVLGALLLDEVPPPATLAGGVLVVAGIFVLNRPRLPSRAAEPTPV